MKEMKLHLDKSEGLSYIDNLPWFFFNISITDWNNRKYKIRMKVYMGTKEFLFDEDSDIHLLGKNIKAAVNGIEKEYAKVIHDIESNCKSIFEMILTADANCWKTFLVVIDAE